MSNATPGTTARPEAIRAVPVRHPGRWVGGVVLLVLLAMFINSMLTNRRFRWRVVGDYLFDRAVLDGVRTTILLTVLAMVIGVLGGILIAVMRLSPNPLVSGSAWLFVWIFRGTPLLVQLLFWNFLAALYPRLGIGIPFGPEWWSESTNVLIPTFRAALLGLGLNEAAYMSEIVRAGLLSVDEGQTEAAHALGMSRLLTLRRIVLPQAMRVIIPPTGNETNNMLKTTSLVAIIAYAELLTTVQRIYAANFQQIPLLIVAIIWYLFMTSILQVGQFYLERYYARGSSRALPLTPWQRTQQVWARFGHGSARGGGA